ncbi:MAG: hypothetical protein ACLVJ6_04140 [Merdibacter sp.]
MGETGRSDRDEKMVTVLCACLFVLGSMAFSASLLSRNLITDTLGETLVEQADIKERISSAISEQLPQSGMLGEQVGTAVASILRAMRSPVSWMRICSCSSMIWYRERALLKN